MSNDVIIVIGVLIFLVFLFFLAWLYDTYSDILLKKFEISSPWSRVAYTIVLKIYIFSKLSLKIIRKLVTGFFIALIFGSICVGVYDDFTKQIDEFSHWELYNICKLKNICVKYDQVTKYCAIAGDIIKCQKIEMGEVNERIARTDCKEVDGTFQVNTTKIPTNLQCLIGNFGPW